MVIRETAHADPFSPRPPARRRRAAPLAVGLSIAVHLGVGAYLINTAFHPMKLAEPPDGPTIDSRMLTLEPTPPPSTRTPPPRIALHTPAGPIPTTVDTLPQAPPRERVSETTLAPLPRLDGAGLVQAPPVTPDPPTVIENPDWLTRPDAEQVARVYPDRAQRESVGGVVELACRVDAAGRTSDCDAVSESPAGYGFAKAARSLAPYFRMKPRRENGAAVGGATVRIPIRFTVSPG